MNNEFDLIILGGGGGVITAARAAYIDRVQSNPFVRLFKLLRRSK